MIHEFIKKYAFERFVNSSVIATIDILMSLIAAVITIVCVDIIAPISIPMHYVLTRGKCVIMVSSEMPELLGICDRILVMSGGRLAGQVDARTATQEDIMALAAKYV